MILFHISGMLLIISAIICTIAIFRAKLHTTLFWIGIIPGAIGIITFLTWAYFHYAW